ncbi:hypothetical protein ALC56_10814 [Trachymyrmex septentrionalis]|uniref:Uncharacterized protein n=1 Tax=Trachymyrmex septentrionalis TaxID=34720 RepID=A0A195F386_9HYME|nr:hypothetical protein ALC56_10814 [Trachymyrmex septentrionalis]
MLEVCVEQAANTKKDEGPYLVYRSATYTRCALVERVCCIRDSARHSAISFACTALTRAPRPPGSEATAASNSKQEQEQQQRRRRGGDSKQKIVPCRGDAMPAD